MDALIKLLFIFLRWVSFLVYEYIHIYVFIEYRDYAMFIDKDNIWYMSVMLRIMQLDKSICAEEKC